MTSTTIPPEDERVSDEQIAIFAGPAGWFSKDFEIPLRAIKLMAIELQSRRSQPDREAIIEAARDVIAQKSSTFKARNGRDVGIQDDSGEKCWIVPHEPIGALEDALKHSDTTSNGGKNG